MANNFDTIYATKRFYHIIELFGHRRLLSLLTVLLSLFVCNLVLVAGAVSSEPSVELWDLQRKRPVLRNGRPHVVTTEIQLVGRSWGKHPFIVDTGSDITIFSDRLVKDGTVTITPGVQVEMSTTTGPKICRTGYVLSGANDGRQNSVMWGAVADLGDLEAILGLRIGGILGWHDVADDFLIDLENLSVASITLGEERDCKHRLPLRLRTVPVVDVGISVGGFDGKFSVAVDTGYTGGIMLDRSALTQSRSRLLEFLNPNDEKKGISWGHGLRESTFAGGVEIIGVVEEKHMVELELIDSLPPVHTGGPNEVVDGLLGIKGLRGYRIRINTRTSMLELYPRRTPGAVDEKGHGTGSGVNAVRISVSP